MKLRKPVAVMLMMLALPALAGSLHVVSQEGRKTEYEGSLSLSGRFEHRQDAETLDWRGDRVCFFPDADAAAQLPDGGNGRKVWFCFSNNRTAAEQLHLAAVPVPAGSCGVTGSATVAITRYVAESGSGDIYDEAWLDHVDRLGDTQPLRCK